MAGKRRVLAVNSLISRLQSSPYFCVNSSTHEQSIKQKLKTEIETGETQRGMVS